MNITERGNIALCYPETDSYIIIAKTGDKDGEYLVSALNGQNYPKWNVFTQFFYDDELATYIMDNFDDWYVDKINGVDVNTYTTHDHTFIMQKQNVIDAVVEYATKKAYDNDYNPAQTDGMIEDCIDEATTAQEYTLSKSMRDQCIDDLFWNFS